MMTDWKKWKRLSGPEKRVLLQGAFLIRIISPGLCLISVKRVHAMLERLSGDGKPGKQDGNRALSAGQIVRLVRIAASRGPARPTCLPQALALWSLLRRHGFDAAIRFGVRKSDNAIEAHAWVELDGRVMNNDGYAGDSFLAFESPLASEQAKIL